jgi:hypothetical protein
MGRGRAKAKQTKVARDLKYNSQEMDIDRLAKELHGDTPNQQNQDDDDPFAEGNYIPRRAINRPLNCETNSVCRITANLRTT